MTDPAIPSVLGGLTTAIAAACHHAQSSHELAARCRDALSTTLGMDALWLTMDGPEGTVRAGPEGFDANRATELFRSGSGATTITLHAADAVTPERRALAMPVCFGMGVALELRHVLLDRQAALADAAFQVQALRQMVRLLSSVQAATATEHLLVEFLAELFGASWAVLLRAHDDQYEARQLRGTPPAALGPVSRRALDHALPPGAAVTTGGDSSLRDLLPPGCELVMPLDAGGERMALVLLGPRQGDLAYRRADWELCQTLALAAAITLKNAELVERLRAAAMTDGLTGLLNRSAIEERLEAEISRGIRHRVRTSVVLIDLDRFKHINDSLGHAAGDRYLVQVGELLRRQMRALDVAGRLGGDEFLVILPLTALEEAMVFVDRVRGALREFLGRHPEFGQATFSAGLAEAPRDGHHGASLLAAADAALYRAKGAGRDTARSSLDG